MIWSRWLLLGTCSLVTMVVIGFDRYNVIVKGFTGTKITAGKATILLLIIWVYSTLGSLPPFIFGWGGYALGKRLKTYYHSFSSTLNLVNLFQEGMLITCSYDYLTEDWNHKTYVLYAFIVNFCVPMSTIIFFYSHIVKAVVSHEASLRAQAKKMNVDSLRSNAVRYFPTSIFFSIEFYLKNQTNYRIQMQKALR